GAPFDLTGDAKTKLFGNYGRYYSRVPNDLAARSLSADDGISRADYFDSGLPRPIPNGTATRTPTGSAVTNHFVPAGQFPDSIHPNAKRSYLDEFGLDVSCELVANTTVAVRYVHRNIGRVFEDVANVPVVAY